jgi:hypothetical protein
MSTLENITHIKTNIKIKQLFLNTVRIEIAMQLE